MMEQRCAGARIRRFSGNDCHDAPLFGRLRARRKERMMTTPEDKKPKSTSGAMDEIPGETVVTTPSSPMGAEPSTPAMGASTARSGDRYAKVKAEAGKLKDQAGGKARSAAEAGKMKAAETLGSVSRAPRTAAEKRRGVGSEEWRAGEGQYGEFQGGGAVCT